MSWLSEKYEEAKDALTWENIAKAADVFQFGGLPIYQESGKELFPGQKEQQKQFGIGSGDLEDYSSGEELAGHFGLSDEYAEYFTPVSQDLMDLLKPGAFSEERSFRQELHRGGTMADYAKSKRSLSFTRGKSNLAYSGQFDKMQDEMTKGMRRKLSQGYFGIEQDIIRKEQRATSMLDEWKRSQRDMATRVEGLG